MIKRVTWIRGVLDEIATHNEPLYIERMNDDHLTLLVGELTYDVIIEGWLWWRKIKFIPQDLGSQSDWVDGERDDRIPF